MRNGEGGGRSGEIVSRSGGALPGGPGGGRDRVSENRRRRAGRGRQDGWRGVGSGGGDRGPAEEPEEALREVPQVWKEREGRVRGRGERRRVGLHGRGWRGAEGDHGRLGDGWSGKVEVNSHLVPPLLHVDHRLPPAGRVADARDRRRHWVGDGGGERGTGDGGPLKKKKKYFGVKSPASTIEVFLPF